MRYRIKTWNKMLTMEDTRIDKDGDICHRESGRCFMSRMRYLCCDEIEVGEHDFKLDYMLGQYGINLWMLEEIPEEPDIYETHKENLFAHGVRLPAMMEVRRGGVWIKKVVFALDDMGSAICNDYNYGRCRPIQKVNVSQLKKSAYLGLL